MIKKRPCAIYMHMILEVLLTVSMQVKTNVGHSEAASGLTAVIKAILAFENAKIPPTYGVKNLNPKREYIPCL